MWKRIGYLAAVVCTVALLSQTIAQPPGGRDGNEPKAKAKDYSNSSIVVKMMAFNKKQDGKLTKDEVTDVRLHRLFDQADANKDGVVTKEELLALAAKLEADFPQDDRRGPGGRGPGDRGPDDRGPGGRGPDDRGPGGRGPDDRGPGGPGDRGPGPRGPGGPPQPGTILPSFLQDRLNLTGDQKKQLEALQKEVDAKLAKILTDEQKQQLKDMRDRGPGGRGPGGRGPGDRGPGDRGPGGRGPGDRGPGDRGPGDRPPPDRNPERE